jgi:hypothetical protein
MNVKRGRDLAYDTLQMLNALQVKTQICARFGPNCYACPLAS